MYPQQKRASRWSRFRDWIHRSPRRTAAIVIGGLLLVSAMVTLAVLYRPPEPAGTVEPPKPTAPEPKKYYSPLTGALVPTKEDESRAVTAVMIENFAPDSRPQSGLKEAGVIYEAIAEGGITRFLALYQQEKPELIGPVRSLRMYYVDWVAPYNASIVHVGGSAAALAEVRSGTYRDIDEMSNTHTYWRATDRYAPHNVYTSFEKIDALNADKQYHQSLFKSFPRTDGKPVPTPDATSIDINFSSAQYNTHYDYDPQSNVYLRYVGGAIHEDREKGPITPSVVVAMVVDMTHVIEDGYRESIKTSGSGRAVIFQNGTTKEATWRKGERSEPLEIVDDTGEPIQLNRGQTWIAATPTVGGGIAWQ